MLASDGRARVPYVVRPTRTGTQLSLDLTPEQLSGLRQAMIAVVEEGTARSGQVAGLQIAGKTGTAQNPHGADHGWFIGFAPAEKPEIVVGAIIEFSQHGTAAIPIVSRAIAHYLGLEETAATRLRVTVPIDSAPQPFQLPVLPRPDSLKLDTVRPILPPADTLVDTLRAHAPPPAR
jgi:membrane peptidoglycan carboxypeptidase